MIKRTSKAKNTSNRVALKAVPSTSETAKVEASSPKLEPSRSAQTPSNKPVTAQLPKAQIKLVKPEAKSVCVAGSFNEWNPAKTPLTRRGDGTWIGELSGISGRHEYLFVVDGQWLPDPNAKESVQNPFGGRNSVLVISQ